MQLIKPSIKLEFVTPDALRLIETAGRTCYKSEDKITSGSAIDFVQMILKRGHDSVLEHCNATVRFICDRGVSHEIVRHRIASFSQESTRYCDYESGHVAFIIPPWVTIPAGIYVPGECPSSNNEDYEWFNAMWDARCRYKTLREHGWKPEQARSVLPNSLKTEIVMTGNFREWRHFFRLRSSAISLAAHPQMREVADLALAEMRQQVRVVFSDL